MLFIKHTFHQKQVLMEKLLLWINIAQFSQERRTLMHLLKVGNTNSLPVLLIHCKLIVISMMVMPSLFLGTEPILAEQDSIVENSIYTREPMHVPCLKILTLMSYSHCIGL